LGPCGWNGERQLRRHRQREHAHGAYRLVTRGGTTA
jgi:hypothetical protein